LNLALLESEIQAFLNENITQKTTSIALKKSPFKGVSSQELAQQLVGKQKAKTKLPSWFSSSKIYYPPSLNLEQTSSEYAAEYKARLVSGDTLIDCTGGFGIDSVAFSKKVETVYHCELNEELQQIAAHNFKALDITNVKSSYCNGIDFALQRKAIDWIYIDPSRRNETKGKVFFLEDCLPNVPEIVDDLFEVTSNIIVKTAPILDISVGLRALKYVKEIHIVAVNNEVKELLWVLHKTDFKNPTIHSVTLYSDFESNVIIPLESEEESISRFNIPLQYLYEPYASIMKAGVFNWLSQEYNVHKLHSQTHLYTTEELIDFPGRKFKIKAVFPFNKSGMRQLMKIKTNVVTRNFKMSVAEIRKKYKLQEGLERYLFFVTDKNNKPIVIDCNKISK